MRLIDGDALWDKFDRTMRTLVKSTTQENLTKEALSLLCGTQLISDAPTIEMTGSAVVNGRWVITHGMKPPEYHNHHECSVCGSYAMLRMPWGNKEELSPWCPNCGAKMDLEGENGRPDTAESGG